MMKKFILFILFLVACGQGDSRDELHYELPPTEVVTEAVTEAPVLVSEERPDAFSGQLTRVEHGNNVAYLLNAPPYGVEEWFPFASYVLDAKNRADVFVFWDGVRTDEELEEYENHVADLVFLPDGVILADILPDDVLQNFMLQLPTFGLTIEQVNNLTPHALIMEFDNEFSVRRTAGLGKYSVQSYFQDFAEENNKSILLASDLIDVADLLFDVPLEQQVDALRDFPSLADMLWSEENLMWQRLAFAYEENPRIYAGPIVELLTQTSEPTTFFFVTMLNHDSVQFSEILTLLEAEGFSLTSLWQSIDEIIRPLPLIFERELRIMWVGNSLTFIGETPTQFNDIALDNNIMLWTTRETHGGVGLDELEESAKAQMKEQSYDFVVLQASGDGNAAWRLSHAARAEGAIPIIFLPAINHDDWPSAEYQAEAAEHWSHIAAVSGALFVDMPRAWVYAAERYPTADLFRPNASHPTNVGAFLNAAVFAGELLGIHVTEVPDWAHYRGEYVERLGNIAWYFVNKENR
ncbi:MAG: TraB/GumN family protein [Defluviitaleaceae bacterium]|nr:TraB/GumN family protein [Defluviitaleaceae bacterium]